MGYLKFFTDKYASGSASVGVDDPLPVNQGALSSTTDSVTNHYARWPAVAPAELQNFATTIVSTNPIAVPAGANAVIVQFMGNYTHAANSFLQVLCSVDGTNFIVGSNVGTSNPYSVTFAITDAAARVVRTFVGLTDTIKLTWILGASSAISAGYIKYQFCTM